MGLFHIKLNKHQWARKSLVLFLACLMILGPKIKAQDSEEGLSFIQKIEEISLDRANRAFTEYLPYVQYNNYQYTGLNLDYASMYSLLEYSPNEQGIFQVAMLYDNQTITSIYQQRVDGLFELARFVDYPQITDLRSDQAVSDGQESRILGSDLSKGASFQSGYNNEYTRTIRAILPSWTKENLHFNDVLVIQETGYSDGQSKWYYFAPNFGIICIEVRDGNDQIVAESRLDRVFNNTD